MSVSGKLNESYKLWDKFNKYIKGNNTNIVGKKRTRLENYNKSKRPKIDEYVSASGVKNYLLQDPILDWFDVSKKNNSLHNLVDVYGKKHIMSHQSSTKSNVSVLCENGLTFEKKINDYLKQIYGSNVVDINTTGKFGCTRENYKRTIDSMMEGIPIILQGVVINDLNKTRGTFDLIVRSDYINKIISRPVLSPSDEIFKAPHLRGNYHYLVIDIKWTTMTLCANGFTIRNEGRFPSYKGQLAVYNCAVGNIQGYIPPKAYIMAKTWRIDRRNDPDEGYSAFDVLGEIDYTDFDNKYINKTISALSWVRTVREKFDTWDIYNPSVPEMYPNCSNKFDSPWTKQKRDVAEKICEMTNVWYVTVKHRENAIEKGVTSWKDPNCNTKTMGFSNSTNERAKIIDAILNINRSDNVVSPKCILNNLSNWKTPGLTDFYVDFETMNCTLYNSNIDIHNSKTDPTFIFMIGIGHEEDGKFKYKCFHTTCITHDEEQRIFNEFIDYVKETSSRLDPNNEYVPRFFHWSPAEVTNIKQLNLKYNNKYSQLCQVDNAQPAQKKLVADHANLSADSSSNTLFNTSSDKFVEWVDIYNIFIKEPIVIKGALDFKLKTIGKSMKKHGLIDICWDDNGPSDGLGAMLDAINCYKSQNIDSDCYKSIILYNEIDCKMLWEILSYLRNNHCA